MGEDEWYEEARRSRAGWRALYADGVEKCRDAKPAQTFTVLKDVM